MASGNNGLVGNFSHLRGHDVFTWFTGSPEIHPRSGRALTSRHGRIHHFFLRATHRFSFQKKARRKINDHCMERCRTWNDPGASLDGLARGR